MRLPLPRTLRTRALLGLALTALVSCTGLPKSGDSVNPVDASRFGTRFHAPDTWVNPGFHGAIVRAAGYDYTKAFIGPLSCSACHGGNSPTEPSANLRAPNCFACHNGGPDGSAFHPWAWMDPTDSNFHGNVVVEAGYDYNRARSGNLVCSACHAGVLPSDPSPNTRAPNCFSCHAGGPDGSAGHPRGWMNMASPQFHGRRPAMSGFTQPGNLSCSACHSAYRGHEGVNTRAPSCYLCHQGGADGSPGHPKGFMTRGSNDFHGTVVIAGGGYAKAKSGTLTCKTCHAGESPSEVSPVALAPNCFACHAGGPAGSTHPTGWESLGSADFHGTVVNAAGGYTKAKVLGKTCDVCHAGSFAGEPSPVPNAPNCFACHAGGPSGSPGHAGLLWAWQKGSVGFHGPVVKAAGDYTLAKAGGLTCNICHAGEARWQVSPVKNASNCFSCHDGGPSGAWHPVGWGGSGSAESHGVFVTQKGGYKNALIGRGMQCGFCHNTEADGPSPWPDVPNCFKCHAGGPTGEN